MSIYELAILGAVSAEKRNTLSKTIEGMIKEFGFELGKQVRLHNAETLSERKLHSAFAAVYFGGQDSVDLEEACEIVSANVPVIPTVGEKGDFTKDIPDFLCASNGLIRRDEDKNMSDLAAAMLECVGLLRLQRRIFLSYRRTESRDAALQLHDLLTARGFDVFLDTHDIRPGEPFQEVLWHRLCDSDVMVMLDTPSYFDSRWTREEIGRARAKDIHVLRIVWPEHKPNRMTDLAETIYLAEEDLEGHEGPICLSKMDEIALQIERLRSSSIASRYMPITGLFKAGVKKIGAHVEGIGAHRAISVRLIDDRRIWAYPVVGIPTAETLHDIAEKALRSNQKEAPVMVYDDIGIRDAWVEHLKWLDENIRTVHSLKVSETGWALAAWEK